jgi:hypothetical protein
MIIHNGIYSNIYDMLQFSLVTVPVAILHEYLRTNRPTILTPSFKKQYYC